MRDLDNLAKGAANKKAALGKDIDLAGYASDPVPHEYVEDLTTLADADKQRMLDAGVEAGRAGRSGTFMQKDSTVIHVDSVTQGLEVIPIKQALEHIPWLQDYYWKLVKVDTDKYTARARLELHDGYFIHVLPGVKITEPVQTCLYLEKEHSSQNIHNIVIAEEGSELHIITGCVAGAHLTGGLHVGISEFYVKKDAKLSFTMIHHWAREMMIRPRSVTWVEEGGQFLSNYVCMKPLESLQTYPTVYLAGKGAMARLYSLLVGSSGSELDVGGRVVLQAEDTRAEVVSRTITNGGKIVARGDLVGEVPGIKAHLECGGLILNGGEIQAIPELHGKAEGVEMSHEAAVGKIAEEAVLYLMSRGVSEREATATIVRGFLSLDIPGLPPKLKAQMQRAIEQSEKDMM